MQLRRSKQRFFPCHQTSPSQTRWTDNMVMAWAHLKPNPGEKWIIYVLTAVQKMRYDRGNLSAVKNAGTASCTRSVPPALYNSRLGSAPSDRYTSHVGGSTGHASSPDIDVSHVQYMAKLSFAVGFDFTCLTWIPLTYHRLDNVGNQPIDDLCPVFCGSYEEFMSF
ncbi:unnamed protein product [Rhizoctonia solani]|uniref:Uncharacterized protein n=1 Tax=Rhizoctonia solani TaxID=456999 RepID=A0A8H3AAN9_9AGAM|nr:unnamed protein product [Rhizoctonia solani]